jgi:hypothetical protein
MEQLDTPICFNSHTLSSVKLHLYFDNKAETVRAGSPHTRKVTFLYFLSSLFKQKTAGG